MLQWVACTCTYACTCACFCACTCTCACTLGCVEKKIILIDVGRHLNSMEGTCVEHKDHFAVISDSCYLVHNTCQKYIDFTKEMT